MAEISIFAERKRFAEIIFLKLPKFDICTLRRGCWNIFQGYSHLESGPQGEEKVMGFLLTHPLKSMPSSKFVSR